jgi:hypothetical protein
MDDLFIESRNKYGKWEDDDAALTGVVTGRTPPERSPGHSAIPPSEIDGEITQDDLLREVNSVSKYGR